MIQAKTFSSLAFLPSLALKLLRHDGRSLLSPTAWVALGGLVLGVASLVVSMAVVSGFESTLRRSISEVGGEVQLMRLYSEGEPWEDLFARLRRIDDRVQAALPFLSIEAVIAHKGKLTGVSLQGLEPQNIKSVLGLQQRVIEGKFNLSGGDLPEVLIGKGIAQNHQLKAGDEFRAVVPVNSDLDPSVMKRKIVNFKVAAVLDLGKNDYNERLIIVPLSVAQKIADVGNRYLGVLVKTKNPQFAESVAAKLSEHLGSGYRIRSWREVNENLFEAVRIERVVIFFVILLIVVAAAVNVATSLYVNVVQKFSRVAILKALGLRPRQLMVIFSLQGIILGTLGSLLGLILGLALCGGFTWLESSFGVIPGGVYRLDGIQVDLRFADLSVILLTTLLICVAAVMAPAKQGLKLSIVEGLRYE